MTLIYLIRSDLSTEQSKAKWTVILVALCLLWKKSPSNDHNSAAERLHFETQNLTSSLLSLEKWQVSDFILYISKIKCEHYVNISAVD